MNEFFEILMGVIYALCVIGAVINFGIFSFTKDLYAGITAVYLLGSAILLALILKI